MIDSIVVSQIMSETVCTVDPEVTLAVAATLMAQRHIGSVLVIDDGRLAGIVTERDVVRACSNAHDAPGRPVAEWMSRNPQTVSPTIAVREALRIMMEGGFRHLPVVDDSRAVGIISMRDIARGLAE